MSFGRAQALADAVLLEGYVLYPYRASSTKNRFRWTFGVLAPKSWSDAGGCERSFTQTEVLIEPGATAELRGRVRLLQVQRRTVEVKGPDGTFRPIDALEVDGDTLFAWEEGDTREIDFRQALKEIPFEQEFPIELSGGVEEEPVTSKDGTVIGRVLRERVPLTGRIVVSCERANVHRPLLGLRVRVENTTHWSALAAPRHAVMRASFVATHVLLHASDAAFVSLLDPPAWAKEAVKQLENVGSYPVLAGDPGTRDLVLSSPIILYDHAQIAPESSGDLFDATEIDEILTLRTMTLTEEEKRQARATDPRAAALLDRVDRMPKELFERLHGAVRSLRNAEMVPRPSITVGARVRLRPGARRTDAQDLLFAGRLATVETVKHDVDGRHYVGVTIDDDPAQELHRAYGRFLYYELDEVELVELAQEAAR